MKYEVQVKTSSGYILTMESDKPIPIANVGDQVSVYKSNSLIGLQEVTGRTFYYSDKTAPGGEHVMAELHCKDVKK